MERRRGFSLFEVTIVLGITAALVVAAALSLTSSRGGKDLKNANTQIGITLREAQSRSISQIGGTSWGVHLDNTNPNAPFFSLFSGTYSTATRISVNPLPQNILFDPSTLASGATLDITFAQITGLPSTSTVITLNLAGGIAPGGTATSSATVNRSSSGQIFFDSFNRTNL